MKENQIPKKPETSNEPKCPYSNQETTCDPTGISVPSDYATTSNLHFTPEPPSKPAHFPQHTTKKPSHDNIKPTCASSFITTSTKPTFASDNANVRSNCDEDISETWADYFEDLTIPVNNPCFDKIRVENDNSLLHEIFTTDKDPLQMVNEDEKWYNNVQTKIKCQGQFLRTFPELQGVRQGGVWSPAAYKIFINSLSNIYETEHLGARIGSVYCGVPSAADDVTFISNDPFELQSMLDIQMFHANKQRYIISSQKSRVLQMKNYGTHS
ncbi:unnamed protein product [Mytilus coruscus]|uniref:Reverse transcriptase domain-containing protein n=1 Tax=Mytilus coruscus TaxID=42192 RepID=A0A6J8DD67_MYTCO|nr:unnamed protein product [Mytilus coruscus]